MKTLLSIALGAGFVAATAGVGFACPYHSASAKHNMTVAEAQLPSEQTGQQAEGEGASTFDPTVIKPESEKPE